MKWALCLTQCADNQNGGDSTSSLNAGWHGLVNISHTKQWKQLLVHGIIPVIFVSHMSITMFDIMVIIFVEMKVRIQSSPCGHSLHCLVKLPHLCQRQSLPDLLHLIRSGDNA